MKCETCGKKVKKLFSVFEGGRNLWQICYTCKQAYNEIDKAYILHCFHGGHSFDPYDVQTRIKEAKYGRISFSWKDKNKPIKRECRIYKRNKVTGKVYFAYEKTCYNDNCTDGCEDLKNEKSMA